MQQQLLACGQPCNLHYNKLVKMLAAWGYTLDYCVFHKCKVKNLLATHAGSTHLK